MVVVVGAVIFLSVHLVIAQKEGKHYIHYENMATMKEPLEL